MWIWLWYLSDSEECNEMRGGVNQTVGEMPVGLDGAFDVSTGIGRVSSTLLLHSAGYLKCSLHSGGPTAITVALGS